MTELDDGALADLRSAGQVTSSRRAIEESLHALRTLMGLDVAFVSRFREGRRRFEFVDSDPEYSPVRVGASDPLEAAYCTRVVDGRIPPLVPDTSQLPATADLAITHRLSIGSHVAVPLHGTDGVVVGTLGCFGRSAEPTLRARDLELVSVFAGLISRHMDIVFRHELEMTAVRANIEALIENSFDIALQPIVELSSGRRAAFEALARFPPMPGTAGWTPDRWFREADRVGLGFALEAAAVEAAVSHLAHLPRSVNLSVNVSALALCGSEEVLRVVAGPHAPRLVVELTEHAEVRDYDELWSVLSLVRAAGARIAVDDAGSGYAGLEHILRLQPEVLKLDRSLVEGVEEHRGRRAMCQAMVHFTRRMGSKLVAEGVETAADLEALRELGVQFAQGYLLGRPEVPARAGRHRDDGLDLLAGKPRAC